MSTPKFSAAYPAQMLQAVDRAIETGELRIPTAKPAAMRLQYQGLRGALRRENKADSINLLGFYIEPDALVLRLKEHAPFAKDIERALSVAPGKTEPQTSAQNEAEALLDRILNPVKST